jgi:class 3 adenylate cyclase
LSTYPLVSATGFIDRSVLGSPTDRFPGEESSLERSQSLNREGHEAEARHANILKCDLVGSTQAKKSFDLGEQLEFQRSFLHIITVVAERYGAHIAGFEGDGALVVLGFAHAMEDAAEPAVRMGLDLIDAVRDAEHRVRLDRRPQPAFGWEKRLNCRAHH